MKLLSCHIENFGIIKNTDYNFDGALTAFCERNGYGKTTLASFLKAMFYGMESDRSNGSFNDRRHFCPFAGGKFGGSVTFESNGATYKIERYFDGKSETKDELTVYCNGRNVQYNRTPGQEFLGIDKESFERTAYISGAEVKILSTGNINKKLSHFVEGDMTEANYEMAISRLNKKIKQYKKIRGYGGLIDEESQKLNTISGQIFNKEKIQKYLPIQYKRLQEIEKQIAELDAQISVAQSEKVVLANWEQYDEKISDIAEKKNKLRNIEQQFPFGVPTEDEVEQAANAIRDRKVDFSLLSRKSFGETDEARFGELGRKYSEGISEASIEDIREKIGREKKLDFQLNGSEAELSDKENRLMQRFVYRVPSSEDVKKVEEMAEQYKSAEKECGDIPDFTASVAPSESPKSGKKLFLVIAFLAVALLIAGIVTAFFQIIAGIVLLVVGIVILFATGFAYLSKKATMSGGIQTENPQKREAKERLSRICAEIQAVLLPYGYSFENGVQYAAMSFRDDVRDFCALRTRIDSNKSETERLLAQRQRLKEEIDGFFAQYGIAAAGHDKQLEMLQSELAEYISLKDRKGNWEEQVEGLRADIHRQSEIISAFCKKYNIQLEGIDDTAQENAIKMIRYNISERSGLKKEIALGKERAEAFRSEKQLSIRPSKTAVDLDELKGKLSQCHGERATLVKEIGAEEAETENIDILQSEYEETKTRLEKYRADYAILSKTVELIECADKSMKDKYIKPVKDSFLRYSESLEKAIGEKIVINADFELRYESDGAERSDEHLSSGQRSLCALCFRLALIDNMYPKQKPFVILDDPFSNLDEAHLSKAKILLQDLANNMQLIYFTCHQSRAL